jgi:hypothetical protein
VIASNIKRRHLNSEYKRDLVAKLLKLNPNQSNLAISKMVGVDDKTVASVRQEMEGRSEIPNVAETTDPRGRKQPVRKAKRAQPAKVDTNSESPNSVKPPATPEQTAAERKEAYARDDAPSSPAPPASSAADDALAQVVETNQPATVEQPAELGTTKKPKVKAAEPELAVMPPQAVRDNENGFISSALWEIERQIASLPTPAEAIARFPTHHHHTFTAAKLRAMADWLAAFADGWQQNIEEPRNGEGSEAA